MLFLEINLQDRPEPAQQAIEVETVILSTHAGTVTLVLDIMDAEEYYELLDEVDPDAPTPVPRARFSQILDITI